MRPCSVYLVLGVLDAGDSSAWIKRGRCFWSSDPFGKRHRGHVPVHNTEEDRCQGNRASGGSGCARWPYFMEGGLGGAPWGGNGAWRIIGACVAVAVCVGSPLRSLVDVLVWMRWNAALMVKPLFHYGPRRCSADHFSDFALYFVKYSCYALGDQALAQSRVF